MITDIINSFRLAHTGYVLAREGVFSFIDANALPPLARPALSIAKFIARKTNSDRSERLTRALGKLGPSHVKFGQFMATRPDIVGLKFARDLESLQDRMPPFSDTKARDIILNSLGKPVEDLFIKFSKPVAAASIAQVHKAKTENEDVAVKVLRPDVAAQFKKDLSSFYSIAHFAERFIPAAARLKPVGIVDTLARSVTLEMDLRLEAAALSEMRENTAQDAGIRIPKPDWERTGRDVLTMEWIDGIPLSDIAALRASSIDLPLLAKNVIQSFLRHSIRDGFFHADMHQGNLFADMDGNLVLIDFGIMGRIGLKERRFLAEILFGFITRNYLRVAQVHFEAGYVPAHHSVETFAQAIRAIGEPIHSLTADQISMAKLFTLLFEITDMFDMQTRTELVMLQKTMVVVEGVARNLDPKLNMWATAEPVVRNWIEKNLGPIGKITEFGEGAAGILSFAPRLPMLLARGENLLSNLEKNMENGSSLTSSATKAIDKAQSFILNPSFTLWIIAGLLAYWVFRA